jgi:hypothetical protein
MQDSAAPWPPRIGDRVGIKGSQLGGVVLSVERRGDLQHFILSVGPLSPADPVAVFRLRTTVGPMRSMHTLDELEPA